MVTGNDCVGSATMVGRSVYDGGVLGLVISGTAYTVDKSHPNYKVLLDAFNNKDAELFLANIDIVQKVQNAVNNVNKVSGSTKKVTLSHDKVFYGDVPLNGVVVDAILNLMRNSFDVTPAVLFLENLLLNPSKRAVDELWNFLQIHRLTLTDDGCFLAYKSVRDDFMDKYSGKINNAVGAKVEVDRNSVDDDYRKHCSHGLHVGALAYSGPGGWYNRTGDKVLIVKVNPKDVVSVPDDHSHQKLRCCAYEVVGEYQEELKKPVFSGVVGEDYSNNGYDDDCCDNDSDEDSELDPYYDLYVDNAYTFTYRGEDRVGVVTSLGDMDEKVTMIMLSGDKSAGGYRVFFVTEIENLKDVDVEGLRVDL